MAVQSQVIHIQVSAFKLALVEEFYSHPFYNYTYPRPQYAFRVNKSLPESSLTIASKPGLHEGCHVEVLKKNFNNSSIKQCYDRHPLLALARYKWKPQSRFGGQGYLAFLMYMSSISSVWDWEERLVGGDLGGDMGRRLQPR